MLGPPMLDKLGSVTKPRVASAPASCNPWRLGVSFKVGEVESVPVVPAALPPPSPPAAAAAAPHTSAAVRTAGLSPLRRRPSRRASVCGASRWGARLGAWPPLIPTSRVWVCEGRGRGLIWPRRVWSRPGKRKFGRVAGLAQDRPSRAGRPPPQLQPRGRRRSGRGRRSGREACAPQR